VLLKGVSHFRALFFVVSMVQIGAGHGFAFWVSFLICLSPPSLHDTPSDVRFHELPFRQMLVALLTLCILSCVALHRISVGVFIFWNNCHLHCLESRSDILLRG